MSIKSPEGMERSDRGWLTNFNERFAYYGTGGLYDPKNYTVEPWLLGGGTVGWTRSAWSRPTLAGFGRGFLLSQSLAFFGVGVIGAVWDPLEKFEGEGLDEYGVPTLIDLHSAAVTAGHNLQAGWDRIGEGIWKQGSLF